MEPRAFWQDAESEPWRILAERKFDEWVRAGLFDNLPGRGQPLPNDDNPFVPADLRLPYKILQNAGAAPPWIELSNQVENQRLRCEKLERKWGASNAPAKGRSGSEAGIANYINALRELNRLIDLFNLSVPIFRLQLARIPVETERQRILAKVGLRPS